MEFSAIQIATFLSGTVGVEKRVCRLSSMHEHIQSAYACERPDREDSPCNPPWSDRGKFIKNLEILP